MVKRRYLDGHYASLETAVSDWQCMSPVSPQLRRPVGTRLADGFTGLCQGCGEEIQDRDLRGRVEEIDPALLSLFALGVCLGCRCITVFDCLVREIDGDVIVQTLERAGESLQEQAVDPDHEPGMRALIVDLQRFKLND